MVTLRSLRRSHQVLHPAEAQPPSRGARLLPSRHRRAGGVAWLAHKCLERTGFRGHRVRVGPENRPPRGFSGTRRGATGPTMPRVADTVAGRCSGSGPWPARRCGEKRSNGAVCARRRSRCPAVARALRRGAARRSRWQRRWPRPSGRRAGRPATRRPARSARRSATAARIDLGFQFDDPPDAGPVDAIVLAQPLHLAEQLDVPVRIVPAAAGGAPGDQTSRSWTAGSARIPASCAATEMTNSGASISKPGPLQSPGSRPDPILPRGRSCRAPGRRAVPGAQGTRVIASRGRPSAPWRTPPAHPWPPPTTSAAPPHPR